MRKAIIYLIMLLALSHLVLSLGIAPARREFIYDTKQEYTGSFRVIAETIPTTVYIDVTGEGDAIMLDRRKVVLQEKEAVVDYKVRFPSGLSPGEKMWRIRVREDPGDASGNVVASPVVIHQVITYVPVEGKYVEATILQDNRQDETLITVQLRNLGDEDVEEIKAYIDIISPTGSVAGRVESQSVSLDRGETGKVELLVGELGHGEYEGDVIVKYDEKTSSKGVSFTIGRKDVLLDRIRVDHFRIGSIAKFDVDIKSGWNTPLPLAGSLTVYSNGTQVDKVEIPPAEALPGETLLLSAYWDTKGLEEGHYSGLLEVVSGDLNVRREFGFDVERDRIVIEGSAEAFKPSGDEQSHVPIIALVAVVVLIFAILVSYSLGIKSPDKREKEHRGKRKL